MDQLLVFKGAAGQLFSNPTWDVLLVLAFIAASFFYGVSSGKQRIVSSIIYTYIAFAIFSALPSGFFSVFRGVGDEFIVKIILFLAVFFALLFLFSGRRGRAVSRASSWWQVFLLSFVEVGFVIHILTGFIAPDKIPHLAPLTKNLFANPSLRVWWFIIPILLVLLLKKVGASRADE